MNEICVEPKTKLLFFSKMKIVLKHTLITHSFIIVLAKEKQQNIFCLNQEPRFFIVFFSYFVILLNRFRHFSCCFFLLVVVKLVSSFINMINRQISSCFFPVFCFHLDFNGRFEPKNKKQYEKPQTKWIYFMLWNKKWQHITNMYSFSHRIRWMMSINVYI